MLKSVEIATDFVSSVNVKCRFRIENALYKFFSSLLREAAKKLSFFIGPATKRGRGGKGLATIKKNPFFQI